MKEYHKAFGQKSGLYARRQDGSYVWQLSIRGLNIKEYSSLSVPEVRELMNFFLQNVPVYMQGCAKPEFRTLRGIVKESIKYLENQAAKEQKAANENQVQ
jgi:hypothetical protein